MPRRSRHGFQRRHGATDVRPRAWVVRAWQTEPEYSFGGMLNPGYVTGTIDGKASSLLLPNIDGWNHETNVVTTAESTGYWQCYDDHVAVARFTPRTENFTDCEIVWLVHPDAREGIDFDPEHVKGLWHVTIQEDIWITDNNHAGIESGAYSAGRYSSHEGGCSGFISRYMKEIVKAGD